MYLSRNIMFDQMDKIHNNRPMEKRKNDKK